MQFWLTYTLLLIFPQLSARNQKTTKDFHIHLTSYFMSLQSFPDEVDLFNTKTELSSRARNNLQAFHAYFAAFEPDSDDEEADKTILLFHVQSLALYLGFSLPPYDRPIPDYLQRLAQIFFSPAECATICSLKSASERLALIRKDRKMPGLDIKDVRINVCLQCGKFKRYLYDTTQTPKPSPSDSSTTIENTKFFRCGYCNTFMTCSKECFGLAWKEGHKEKCHRLHKKEMERLEALQTDTD